MKVTKNGNVYANNLHVKLSWNFESAFMDQNVSKWLCSGTIMIS